MRDTKFYVTTPIYYVNDRPHIGHAYATVSSDIFARYHRIKKGKENVFFLSGTDEHGSKVAKSAVANNLSPQEFADKVSAEYREVWDQLGISYDEFIRTTDPGHKKVVGEFLQDLYDKGCIYKGVYKGVYCIGCEKFLPPDEIVNGACIYHPNVVLAEQEEENYFFKLKDFSAKVLEAYEKGEYKVFPPERANEIISKIKGGINDVSISRAGVKWGIPLPWDPEHTVYVWVDALINYYSATIMYPGREGFWPADLHVVGKDILWFHALIWEGLLLAKGLDLPKNIFAHGFFTIDGQKISKTLGNVIDPRDLVKEYGRDGTRYLLLSAFSFGNDGDISLAQFKTKFNADLANGVGNLVSRIAKLCENSGFDASGVKKPVVGTLSPEVESAMENFKPDEALRSIWKKIGDLDLLLAEEKPWKIEDAADLATKLGIYIEKLLVIAHDLEPFLPETSAKIATIFSAGKVTKPEPIFLRK